MNKFLQPLVSPPIGIGLSILVNQLTRMAQKVKTLMCQSMQGTFLQIIKSERHRT